MPTLLGRVRNRLLLTVWLGLQRSAPGAVPHPAARPT